MIKTLLIAVAFSGIITAEAGKWGVEEHDEVAVLTKDNFDEFIKTNKYVFVKFYAPWCGHCKSMTPAYIKLAQRMKAAEKGVPITKVDASTQTSLGERFAANGYPTLTLFINGEPVEYSGSREEDSLYNWIMKKSGPSTAELRGLDELAELQKQKIAVLLVAPTGDQTTMKTFEKLAISFDDISFHYTTSPDVRAHLSLTDKVNLVLIRSFDDGNKQISGDSLTIEAMKDFLNSNKNPLVTIFEKESAPGLFGTGRSAIFIFNDETETPQATIFKNVAKRHKGDSLTFFQSKITSGLGASLSEFLGITPKDANTIRIIKFDPNNLLKYKIDNITEESLEKFIDDWQNNRLSAYIKSESVPVNNSESVKVLVGDNFEELVLKSENWVLVEAYAPWCDHCKNLEPIYNELAIKLAHNSDITIAKIDATANDHPALKLQGFPTIRLYKKGDKSNPVDFSGERTLEGLRSFLEKEVGRSLTGTDNTPIDTSL
jgi:protein disulfide-isomerase A1